MDLTHKEYFLSTPEWELESFQCLGRSGGLQQVEKFPHICVYYRVRWN